MAGYATLLVAPATLECATSVDCSVISDEGKERRDAIDWDEDGAIPRTVEPEALNRWLFNEDTVDKVLEQLMRSGEKVADGDRLGKTIIFAKNHAHAQFIADRFDKNYPHHKGIFARVIDFRVEYAQSLIDDFSIPTRAPHIAISVDMLDTGIDIPEIVNLVFFKMVRGRSSGRWRDAVTARLVRSGTAQAGVLDF